MTTTIPEPAGQQALIIAVGAPRDGPTSPSLRQQGPHETPTRRLGSAGGCVRSARTEIKPDSILKAEAHLQNYVEKYIKKHGETLYDGRAGAADPMRWTRTAHEFARDGSCATSQPVAKLHGSNENGAGARGAG